MVDSVLEDIRLGMEVNLPKFNQRRVAQVRYLGELYNYRMVESADVFKVCLAQCCRKIEITLCVGFVGFIFFDNFWSFHGPKQSIAFRSS